MQAALVMWMVLGAHVPSHADDWADAQAAFDGYDDRHGLALLQRAAQGCDVRAQRAWGLALRYGERLFAGLAADPAASKAWLDQAADAEKGRSRCSADLPPAKRTKQGLYLYAAEVPQFIASSATPVLFLDVRTRAEATYVGMPQVADLLVPYMEHEDFEAEWDTQRGTFRPEIDASFAQAVASALARKGLSRGSPVVLICRSGDRSAKASDLLAQLGFSQVYSVVDGFEGDLSAEGRRSVNGWKNAGLPWAYRLEQAKVGGRTR
jgi:rhodanese-related sulfurtransferase